jgi:uncharacterized membrane protein
MHAAPWCTHVRAEQKTEWLPMNSPVRRSLEIDFFRGLVLIVIALDHIEGSVLSRFMLHSYAY